MVLAFFVTSAHREGHSDLPAQPLAIQWSSIHENCAFTQPCSQGIYAGTACSLLALPASAAPDKKPTTAPAQHAVPAQRPPGGPSLPGPAAGRGGANGDKLIERADSNNDGKLSVEEFLAPRLDSLDKMFDRRDANGDGLIAQGEGRRERPAAAGARGNRTIRGLLRGNRPARPAPDRAAILACVQQANPAFAPPAGRDANDETRFEAADTNNDGNLSLSEVTAAETAQAKAQFARLDANSDGFITAADIEARQNERAAAVAAMRDCMKKQ